MSYEEKVYTKLKQHYHCAQAIFATYASDYGMDQETAYRTMACFAAGMYRGSVCGCVTAALAVLGLAYGFSDTKDREREIFGTKIAEEFVDRFQERMEGKFNCADILENNINTAEGMASIRREGMIKKKCTQAIQTSIEILEDMLRAYPDMLAGKPAEPSCDEQEIEKITYLVKRAQKIQHFESNVRDLILHSSKSIACIQFDISRFKIINDIYGERMGDQILQFIKDNLAEICNETQYYLNLRSDVFVVLSEFQQESELDELVRQIQTRCNMFKNIKLTYSIGVYIVNDRKMDLRQIEDRAAMARKKAKGNMMNNVLYYQEEFQNGSKADREKICEQADTGLRKLQKQCTEKEESRKILQLLAVNSEYQENYENAGFYYEQMLLYDETYRAGYGEYGMFLFRTGQKEAGQALWTEYKSKETMLDDTVSRNLRLWEKEMTKSEEKS